jgi:hypothetical protein
MPRQYPPYVTAGTVPASGFLALSFTPRGSQLHRVTQVAAEMAGAGAAAGVIRRNGAIVTPFVPTGGAAGGDPPIWLWPGDLLTVEWTGAPVGAVGKATVFYDLPEDAA